MSPKAKKAAAPAKPAKKDAAAKAAPLKAASSKAAKPGKAEKKSAKKGDDDDMTAAADGETPAPDMDEIEDAEDEAASKASGGGGNAAALAAATGSADSASFKNFRHHPDMENFYRFIHENDLRFEALVILDKIMGEKLERRAARSGGGKTPPAAR